MIQRRTFFASFATPWLATLPAAARAQGATEIGTDAARRDLRILKRAFEALHPGLYRYATPAQIDAEFAVADAAVAQGSSRAGLYLLASRLAAAVRCGHTWTNPYNQSAALDGELKGRADKLPLTLRWVEGRVQVTGSSAAGVAAGDELLAVDGRPVAAIAGALLPFLRADGEHRGADGKRLSQLDSGVNGGAMDRLFPLLFPPQQGRYLLRLRAAGGGAPREQAADAVTLAAREALLPPASDAWSFSVEGDTGVLTLPTFSFWRSDFKPTAFLDASFEALRGVPFLVIDQRRNEGGDDAIGRDLLGRLLRRPYETPASRVESACERAPYMLARYLDTWDYGFFDRTGKVTRGPGRNWLLPELPPRRVAPAAAPYPGRTLVLVGPQNSSAGFLFARDLQRSGAAMLVGETTGGNLRGLNGGELAWITLPASGVAVDIPLLAAITPGEPPDAGVEPAIAAPQRWADTAAGVDSAMAAAQAQIARWRGGAR